MAADDGGCGLIDWVAPRCLLMIERNNEDGAGGIDDLVLFTHL